MTTLKSPMCFHRYNSAMIVQQVTLHLDDSCQLFQVVMKMLALTPGGYWQSRRNRFDMFVTLLGVIWICLHFSLMAVREG